MNWTVPPLTDSPRPSLPHWIRWGIALLIMVVAGFFLTVYLLPEEKLQDKNHLLLLALGAPLLLWGLTLGIRLIGYDLQSAAVNARNHEIEYRRKQWKRWSNQKLNLLAWGRETASGAQDYHQIVSEQPPVNQGNRLTMSEFSSKPVWESRSLLIARLLQPVHRFMQSHPTAPPLTLLWKVSSSAGKDIDWEKLLQKEIQSLPVAEIAELPHNDFTEWLLTASGQPPDNLLCLLFIDLCDASPASEEAVSLLIASDSGCEQAKVLPKAQLLRPLLTSPDTLPLAITQLCGQQHATAHIAAVWQASESTTLNEQIPLSCAALNIHLRAGRIFDINSALGLAGCARHAAQITLAAEHNSLQLLFTEHQGQCLIQQLMPLSGASQ